MSSKDTPAKRSIRYVIKITTPRELNGVEKDEIVNGLLNRVPVGTQVSKLKKVNLIDKTSRESI